MSVKCPKCQSDNPETAAFCADCGTLLRPVRGTDPTDVGPDPRSGRSFEDISVTETMEAPKEELTRGATFADRYEIIEELGSGGMGRVYRVEDIELKQEVALKLIKPEIAKDKKTIERFRNELKLARNIRHKNVCGMYDLGEKEGAYFITMEYVRGEDLKSFIHRSGQLAVGTIVRIAAQVCEGLAEAHRLGVVHRDLKSNNIMIDKEGNVRIMDFGIARFLEKKGITGSGVMIGTPEYMSPEQLEGKEVDKRSDIYSLGVILYEMATGRVPFEGETPFAVGMRHKAEIPTEPKKHNSQVPDDLNRLILKCLEKNQADRYQSAVEVRAELKNIEKGIPTMDRVIPGKKPQTLKEITVTFGLKKLLIPVLVVVAIVIAVLAIWWLRPQKQSISPPPDKPSIAVLPFEDLSPGKDQEYFCDGLADELINRLTKIESLRIPARTSAFSFKGKALDIREIGAKLNVNTVLEGSVRKSGNRLRITVQLINIADGYPLWSERYERDEKDIFFLQDEISLAIVDNLKIKILGTEKVKLTKRYTDNLEAYNQYLKGQYFWNKRTEQNLRTAIEYFISSIDKDPKFLNAYIGLAQSYGVLPDYSPTPSKDSYSKAMEAVRRAIEIDKTSAEAFATLGLIKKNIWDWEGAEKDLKRAIQLNNNYAHAHHWLAMTTMYQARFEEALEEIKLALELDPLSLVINRNVGNILFYARKYDQAIEPLQKTLEFDANFSYTHAIIGRIHLHKSNYEKALSELMKEREILGIWNPLVESAIGLAYIRMGKQEKAKELLDSLLREADKTHIPSTCLAALYFVLGEDDQGFSLLNRAYEENDSWLDYLKIDHVFDNIRSDPRYLDMLNKIGLDNNQ